jgi:two-component system, NarL family, sensor histidine kinase DesK
MSSTTRSAAGTTATVVPVARPELSAGPVPGDGDLGRAVARGRLGWIFAAVWLVYLLPVLQEAMAVPSTWRRVVGVAAVVAFGVAYVWSFMQLRRWRRRGWRVPPGWRIAVLGLSVALFVVAVATVRAQALAILVFVAVQAVFVLPRRAGLVGAGVCVVAAEALARIPGWSSMEEVGFSVALAAIAMWGVTGMLQRNVELAQAQARLAELAVQNERSRFARDLHDILGHSLTVLTVKAELAGRLVALDPERAEREIAEVEQLARQAMADVRAAVSGYREASLPGELASARAALYAAGITADLPTAADAVPPERRELLAWTIREGVTNAVRHSAARHVWVRLDADGVEVADDGRGPAGDPGAVGVRGDQHGHGLAGLRERAAAVGAAVTVSRREGGGFVLRVGW